MNDITLLRRLFNKTVPHGKEHTIYPLLPKGSIDKAGNYFVKVGESKVLFIAHLDDVSRRQVKINIHGFH